MNRNAFYAGLFIVLSIAAALMVIVGLKGASHWLEPSQTVTIGFKLTDDIGGLQVGDAVRIGGAKVGDIHSIDFIEHADQQPTIRVSFTLPKKFVLHPNAEVAIQSTVTGVSVLNFTSLGSGTPLAANQDLTGHPGALAALFDAAGEISAAVRDIRGNTLPKVNAAVDVYHETGAAAKILLADADKQLDPVTQKFHAVADAAHKALELASGLLGDSGSDLRQTFANVRDVTATAKTRLPQILDQFNGTVTKINTAIDDTTAALQDVKKTAGNASAVSASVRQILADNRGKIETLITSLKTTGDNLKSASAEIRRSPWRLLYKPGPGEMANLNLYDSARQFAEGASRLNDTAAALRDLSTDPQADPAQIKKLLADLDQQFKAFDQVEQGLWKQVQP